MRLILIVVLSLVGCDCFAQAVVRSTNKCIEGCEFDITATVHATPIHTGSNGTLWLTANHGVDHARREVQQSGQSHQAVALRRFDGDLAVVRTNQAVNKIKLLRWSPLKIGEQIRSVDGSRTLVVRQLYELEAICDGFAQEGDSGRAMLDSHGHVVGVVLGGHNGGDGWKVRVGRLRDVAQWLHENNRAEFTSLGNGYATRRISRTQVAQVAPVCNGWKCPVPGRSPVLVPQQPPSQSAPPQSHACAQCMARFDGLEDAVARLASQMQSQTGESGAADMRGKLQAINVRIASMQTRGESELSALQQRLDHLQQQINKNQYDPVDVESELAALRSLINGLAVRIVTVNGDNELQDDDTYPLNGMQDNPVVLKPSSGNVATDSDLQQIREQINHLSIRVVTTDEDNRFVGEKTYPLSTMEQRPVVLKPLKPRGSR